MELSDRSRRLLAALIREYIETGEPVSSHALVRKAGIGVSSATVRNVLVQLEDMGFVHQPHTSAGRVPTDRGYRFFVDVLLASRRANRSWAAVEAEVLHQAGAAPLMDALFASVSQVVARASRQVAFTLASTAGAIFQHIDFVPLGGTRVLVVVVARGSQVTQKAVDTGEALEQHDLVQAANYLNTEFAGLPLRDVRAAVLERLAEERTLYARLLVRALRLASTSFDSVPEQQLLFVEGVSTLIGDHPDDGAFSLATLGALLRMMEEKERLLHLLNQYIDGPGLTVVIGAEHASPDLRPFSLVASTYVDGPTTGTVGVIGPTRMHYSRAISVVDGVAQTVSRLLRHAN